MVRVLSREMGWDSSRSERLARREIEDIRLDTREARQDKVEGYKSQSADQDTPPARFLLMACTQAIE